MDFTTSEAATDLGGLVATITESVCTNEHQRELDRAGQRFDRALWDKLITADVLSAAAPESIGGGGYGIEEAAAIATALGRQLAAVPYLESVLLAAGAIAEFGSPALAAEWAAPAVAGTKILTVALTPEMGAGPVRAATGDDGVLLTGTRTQVNYARVADAILVPAETDSGTAVYLVDADAPGLTVTPLDTTGKGNVAHLKLDGVSVGADRRLGDGALDWLRARTLLGYSAYQLGVLERALELTASYAAEREQFDRPIGSFQAVAQRLADGYIDVKGLRLTLTQAVYSTADVDIASAAFWAAEAGHRVAHTAVHVHGGVGIDEDHPIHRYFLFAKQTEFGLGGATGQLLAIGRELADTPV
ncbi:acyl-CoA dehydrogenase [Mycolicibacterium insubricum]|uniref:Acyl-CoA dehydrogenase n=1 Tax=Mycolicibacterium insubricum TaxID=444597 RepID=A0A1X0CWP3_9MYCO|nr:acyl-CoA dehydrogenase [Mycolicibacterium insubricum]MCV7083554.1 acyl-CoA dehydrogenase [Mycolicibacterium insubricum]ORA64332.1 acyl-CoA dehydrogenase [Mycolicibacterium insubricum]BBZ68865.1 acyl-CoA dehydrogenase [Mycolicibacterium insubricum]